jgi:Tol biopolymer transport system component/pimeloyl-ACP methyl ester carboxylesterase
VESAATATIAPTVEAEAPTATDPLPSDTPVPEATLPPWEEVTLITEDGAELAGALFGSGETAVVLAHQGGGNADQTSWHAFAQVVAEHGMAALSFDFRGHGRSVGPRDPGAVDQDVTAAVQFLRERGYEKIVCIGASMGGTACTRVAVDDGLAGLVTLGSTMVAGMGDPVRVSTSELASLALPKMFITAEEDTYAVVDHTQRMYEVAPEPKALHLLPGEAHGTDLFSTDQGEALTAILLEFLENPPVVPPTPTPEPTPTPTPTEQAYEAIKGLAYVEEGDPARKISLYLPSEARRESQTLLVYGGEGFPQLVRHFAELGYTVIAFSSRDDSYLAETEDGFCALAWAHANADAYGFDAAQIVALGGSMWGGNAALLGLVDDPGPYLEGCPHAFPERDRLRAVIALAGVFDYSEEGDFFSGFIGAITDYMGGRPDEVPENWAAASAITWVQGDGPPFLLVHGTSDTNVAHHQSEKFAAALESAGNEVELVLLPGVNHFNSVTSPRVFEAMESFLEGLGQTGALDDNSTTMIAFTSERDGNSEIYVMAAPGPGEEVSAGGGEPVRLTDDPAYDAWPVWSPDGTQIAFTSDRRGNPDILIMAADGSEVRHLTRHSARDIWPDWSPDGTRIAFVSDRDGNFEVYTVGVDGTNLQRLTNTIAHEDFAAWSPDGTQIVFSRVGGDDGTYVMNADGSGERQLAEFVALESDWSPDGTRIAFGSDHEGFRAIYVMDADGSNLQRLSQTSAGENCPDWSPDGERIVFASWRDGDGEIYVMDADGGNLQKLTDNRFVDEFPAWHPELPVQSDGGDRAGPNPTAFGGPTNDRAFDVLVTSDGGTLVAGMANNTGLSHRITPGNARLTRTDARGAVIWEKEYGGEDDAYFTSIIEAGEDEYVLLGEIAGSYLRDETDVYLVKVDGEGNEIWSRTFGGRGMDHGEGVRKTLDGGYILIGGQADEYPTGNVYEGSLYLIKTDAEGNEVWSRTYGDEILYLGWGVAELPDGGFVLTGWEAKTIDDRDVILLRTDESGEVVWSRTWDLGERDGGFDLILTSDGCVVMACIQSMGSGAPSARLLKADLDGNEVWNKLIGEEGVGNTFWDIVEDTDGGYLMAGDTHLGKVPGTGRDRHGAWMVKTDADGEILWQQVYDGGEYDQAHFNAVALIPGGGYIFAGDVTREGETYSDMLWMKIDD